MSVSSQCLPIFLFIIASFDLGCSVNCFHVLYLYRKNLSDSNTNDSFTVDNSNSFLSPQEILPTAQENKYLRIARIFSYFIIKMYVVYTH